MAPFSFDRAPHAHSRPHRRFAAGVLYGVPTAPRELLPLHVPPASVRHTVPQGATRTSGCTPDTRPPTVQHLLPRWPTLSCPGQCQPALPAERGVRPRHRRISSAHSCPCVQAWRGSGGGRRCQVAELGYAEAFTGPFQFWGLCLHFSLLCGLRTAQVARPGMKTGQQRTPSSGLSGDVLAGPESSPGHGSSGEAGVFPWGQSVMLAASLGHCPPFTSFCWQTLTLWGRGPKLRGDRALWPGVGNGKMAGMHSTGDRMVLPAATHTLGPLRFRLQAVCEVGAPRGGAPAQGSIALAAPLPREALGPAPPPPQPRSPGCVHSGRRARSLLWRTHTQGHRRAFTGQHPGPAGQPPSAQQAWEREALPFSPPRWETRGWRGRSGAVALGRPAERGSGCPWRAAASRWRGLGGPGPRSCQPGAPPAGRGLHASGASAAAPQPAPRAAAGWATVPAPRTPGHWS